MNPLVLSETLLTPRQSERVAKGRPQYRTTYEHVDVHGPHGHRLVRTTREPDPLETMQIGRLAYLGRWPLDSDSDRAFWRNEYRAARDAAMRPVEMPEEPFDFDREDALRRAILRARSLPALRQLTAHAPLERAA